MTVLGVGHLLCTDYLVRNPFRPPRCGLPVSRFGGYQSSDNCSVADVVFAHGRCPSSAVVCQNNRANGAGAAWTATYMVSIPLSVTKSSVIYAKAPTTPRAATRVVTLEDSLTEWQWLWLLAGPTCCAEATASGILRLKCSAGCPSLPC